MDVIDNAFLILNLRASFVQWQWVARVAHCLRVFA
jgi:hypothetical protein